MAGAAPASRSPSGGDGQSGGTSRPPATLDGAAQDSALQSESAGEPSGEPPGEIMSALDLSALTRRMDEDRWLASRFAPKTVRPRLDALYAVAGDLARAADSIAEPVLAQMRLTWWRNAIEAMLEYREAALPPSVRALATVHAEVGFDRETMLALLEARVREWSAEPFETWADLDSYVDATAGSLMRLAMQAVDPALAPNKHLVAFTRSAGRAWGYTGLLRSLDHWRLQGRSFFPTRVVAHFALEEEEFRDSAHGFRPQAAIRALLDRAIGAYRETSRLSASVPTSLFPAYGYVALTPHYIRRLEFSPPGSTAQLPLLRRQLAVLMSSIRGIG